MKQSSNAPWIRCSPTPPPTRNLPEWSDVSDVAMLTDDPVGQGSRLRMTMGEGPMRATLDFDISRMGAESDLELHNCASRLDSLGCHVFGGADQSHPDSNHHSRPDHD